MFREMRRNKQQLSQADCVEILKNEPRGVLAVKGEDGYPYALPMDFIYIDGALYFHSSKVGHKTDAMAADDRVSFCVTDKGFHKNGDWALNIASVIVFGRMSQIEDESEAMSLVRRMALKYNPDPQDVEAEIERAFDRVRILKLSIDHMTGKRVREA